MIFKGRIIYFIYFWKKVEGFRVYSIFEVKDNKKRWGGREKEMLWFLYGFYFNYRRVLLIISILDRYRI